MIWFKFYSSWGDGIQELTDEEAGRFIKAICRFAESGKAEAPSGIERILFAMASKQMQQDAEHAEKVSSARAESGRLGGLVSSGSKQMQAKQANASNCLQNEANASNCEQMQAIAPIKNKELRIKNQEQRIKNSEVEQEVELTALSKKTEVKHRRGQYKHVLLTDSEVGKLAERFPNDWQKKIQHLDDYLQNNKKKHYDDHYLTICKWASADDQKTQPKRESWSEIAERISQEVAA